jgi:hypothetical protein
VKHILDSLCEQLDAELERQETLRAVARAQADAMAKGNHDDLNQATRSIESLARASRDAESGRVELARRAAVALGVSSSCPSLRELAMAAPDPWRERLAWYRDRLNESVADNRALLVANGRRMHMALSVLNQGLAKLLPRIAGEVPYTASGPGAAPGMAPSMLDSRG